MSDEDQKDDAPRPAWEKVTDIGEARESAKGNEVYIKRKRGRYCRHLPVHVDAESRKVVCGACEAELDPIQVIVTFAHEWERYSSAMYVHKGEAERRFESLEEVRRQERNAKARLRRLKKKVKEEVGAPFDLDLVESPNSSRIMIMAVEVLHQYAWSIKPPDDERAPWWREKPLECLQAILDKEHPTWRRWLNE